MMVRFAGALSVGSLLVLGVIPAFAADIQPHRALYALSLGSAKASSGVLGASGAMTYEWGETCGGWTVEQRFRLKLEYSDQDGNEINTNLVTWEAKDGSRYRFNERRMRNGELDEEIRGEAHMNLPQSYLLGFDAGSAKLNPLARAAIERAAAASRQTPNYNVLVVGHGAGVKVEDERLSRQRTESVRAELMRAGVPATAIKIASGPTSRAPIQSIQESSGGKVPEHRVDIVLEPMEPGGAVEYTKPEQVTIPLRPETLFPTQHTLYLIDRAKAGDTFAVRNVFDGTSVENATLVSAVLGKMLPAGENGLSPLLNQPSWHMRLAFFPAESKSEQPDYEMSMLLLANGISDDMSLDYGDYIVKARLDRIEPMPKPSC